MHPLEYKFFYQRSLPHYQPPGATLFVTFRLVDSLPKSVVDELMAEAERIEKLITAIEDPVERRERAHIEQRKQFGRWDQALNKATIGPFWLSDKAIAQIVYDSLCFLDGKHYDLDVFCIMSNHVHIVIKPLQQNGVYISLAKTLSLFKSYTARRANELLGRSGQFWHRESYDHVIRNEAEWKRVVEYVLNNPVKVGLVDDWRAWPWNFCKHLLHDAGAS